jgi:DNA-binding LacI/PurR family transcriptional regulator
LRDTACFVGELQSKRFTWVGAGEDGEMSTIKDVARRAGVSISTVSYALSGKRSVSEETRSRVEAAVRALRYRPNAGARILASARTQILALSAPMHDHTYPAAFMTFVRAVTQAAHDHDYDVVLLTECDDAACESISRVVSTGLVDGVILMDVVGEDARVPLLRALGVPSAVIGLPEDREGMSCVDMDFGRAARMCVARLADAGCVQIGLVGQPQALYDRGLTFAVRFREAFQDECRERRLGAAVTTSDAPGAVARLRTSLHGLDALVLDCGEYAVEQVLDELRETGEHRLVGAAQGLSIVVGGPSFDPGRFDPPLDAVPVDPVRSGSTAVSLLLGQVDGGTAESVELYAPSWVRHGSVRNGGGLS